MTRIVQALTIMLLAGWFFGGAFAQAAGGHRVVAGETLFSIAQKELGAGNRWREIAERNRLEPPFVIRPGMVLLLPGADERVAEQYPVPPGDTPAPAAVVATTADSVVPFYRYGRRSDLLPETTGSRFLRNEQEAVALALADHPELRGAAARVAAARTGLAAAVMAGRRNPEIEVEGGGRRAEPADGQSGRSAEYGVFVSREFELAGQAEIRDRLAQLELERELAAAAATRRELVLAIRSAFLEALLARAELGQAGREEEFRHELATVARERFAFGAIPRVEVALAEVEAGRAVSLRLTAEREYRAAISGLRRIIGRHDLELATDAVGMPLSPLPEEPLAVALAERLDLRIARLEERILREQAGLVLAEGRPNITLGGGYRREEGADIVAGRIMMPFPLFNRNQPEVERLQYTAAATDAAVAGLVTRIREEVANAVGQVRSAEERLAVLRGSVVEKSDANIALLLEAYREGKIGLAELIVHQGEAFASHRLLIEATAEQSRAVLELERAMGVADSMAKTNGEEQQ